MVDERLGNLLRRVTLVVIALCFFGLVIASFNAGVDSGIAALIVTLPIYFGVVLPVLKRIYPPSSTEDRPPTD